MNANYFYCNSNSNYNLIYFYCNPNYNLNYLNCRKLQLWIRCSPTVTPSAWDPSTSELRDICWTSQIDFFKWKIKGIILGFFNRERFFTFYILGFWKLWTLVLCWSKKASYFSLVTVGTCMLLILWIGTYLDESILSRTRPLRFWWRSWIRKSWKSLPRLSPQLGERPLRFLWFR